MTKEKNVREGLILHKEREMVPHKRLEKTTDPLSDCRAKPVKNGPLKGKKGTAGPVKEQENARGLERKIGLSRAPAPKGIGLSPSRRQTKQRRLEKESKDGGPHEDGGRKGVSLDESNLGGLERGARHSHEYCGMVGAVSEEEKRWSG